MSATAESMNVAREGALVHPHETRALVVTTPADLLRMALEKNAGMEQIEKFMEMQLKWEANNARQAFNKAFAAFKAEAVTVLKGTEIKDGPLKGRHHANLHDVVVASTGALAKHGLSTSWKLSKDEPQWMEVTCTLRHEAGHSESVSMAGAPDTGPGRNAIQARGSTKTYLERYTLMAILGLAAAEQDNDGGGGSEVATINADQEATIVAKAEEVGCTLARLCNHLKIDAIRQLPASAYKDAIAALDTFGKKAAREAAAKKHAAPAK